MTQNKAVVVTKKPNKKQITKVTLESVPGDPAGITTENRAFSRKNQSTQLGDVGIEITCQKRHGTPQKVKHRVVVYPKTPRVTYRTRLRGQRRQVHRDNRMRAGGRGAGGVREGRSRGTSTVLS